MNHFYVLTITDTVMDINFGVLSDKSISANYVQKWVKFYNY
jgi:hypothetical protein